MNIRFGDPVDVRLRSGVEEIHGCYEGIIQIGNDWFLSLRQFVDGFTHPAYYNMSDVTLLQGKESQPHYVDIPEEIKKHLKPETLEYLKKDHDERQAEYAEQRAAAMPGNK